MDKIIDVLNQTWEEHKTEIGNLKREIETKNKQIEHLKRLLNEKQ